MEEGQEPPKISDLERQIELIQADRISPDKALEIAVQERKEKEKKMGPPQEPPKEACEEEYLRLKGELEKDNK